MHHRFQGFLWNLYEHLESRWYVNDIYPDHMTSTEYVGKQAFREAHQISTKPYTGHLIETPSYTVNAYTMSHQGPSMAYIVREAPRLNVDTTRLTSLALTPGSWLKQLKNQQSTDSTLLRSREPLILWVI